MCRWWHEAERAIVKPKVVLALGASAARAMLGKTVSISKVRGEPIALDHLEPDAAFDELLISRMTQELRGRIQGLVDTGLADRESIWS